MKRFRKILAVLSDEVPPDSAFAWLDCLIEGQLPGSELAGRLEREADLLVIGCHGRNALSIELLGSNAAEVVRHAAKPVLVVKRKNQNLGFLRELIGWEG